jgi:hypothetical protein
MHKNEKLKIIKISATLSNFPNSIIRTDEKTNQKRAKKIVQGLLIAFTVVIYSFID